MSAMTRTTTACRMGRPSPPYFARLHSFSFDVYVINRCHRSAKRSIPNRQNTIRAIFNGSATYINRTSICTVFDSQCTIIINRAISACFRCRRINYAPPVTARVPLFTIGRPVKPDATVILWPSMSKIIFLFSEIVIICSVVIPAISPVSITVVSLPSGAVSIACFRAL